MSKKRQNRQQRIEIQYETIDEVKQEVAEEYGYKSNSVFSAYEQIVINPHYISHDNLINIYDEVTIRYASQFEDRIKELEDELDRGVIGQNRPIV